MRHLLPLLLAGLNIAYAGSGTLELQSTPGGAEVFVDGKKKGTTPEIAGQNLSIKLPEGDHEVEVKKAGTGAAKKTVFVGEDVVQPLTLNIAPKVFTNSLGMKFSLVPIKRGKTNGQRVMFSIWETRYIDFKAFVDDTGYDASKNGAAADTFRFGPFPAKWGQTSGEHPAICVSWVEANEFCQWLTTKEQGAGRIAANQRYRLPTDHEWSCAAGIGDKEFAFAGPEENDIKMEESPWGVIYPPTKDTGNYAFALECDSFKYTSPVGSFPANAYGLYDMSGNVWEWCEDQYKATEPDRVLRGASWVSKDHAYLAASYRNSDNPKSTSFDWGFRCVLVTSP